MAVNKEQLLRPPSFNTCLFIKDVYLLVKVVFIVCSTVRRCKKVTNLCLWIKVLYPS